MFSENFIVGFGSIALYSGVVVLDLTGLSPTERDAQGQPTKELRQRIVMTPEAMLETFNAMQSLMAKLEQQGLVRRTGPGDAPTPATAQVEDSDEAKTEEGEKAKKKGKKGKGDGQPKTPNF